MCVCVCVCVYIYIPTSRYLGSKRNTCGLVVATIFRLCRVRLGKAGIILRLKFDV